MKLWNGQKFDPSKPEILAAYADGEFEGNPSLEVYKLIVESWLESHPEAGAEIAAWRQLKRAWQKTAPPNPSLASWDKTLRNVQRGVDANNLAKSKKRAAYWSWFAGAAAAAVLLALVAGGYWLSQVLAPLPDQGPSPMSKQQPKTPEVEEFLVAEQHEIEILRVDNRIDGDDEPTLPVGNLPVEGPLVLADFDDIEITEVQPNTNGAVPEMIARSDNPMIWAGGGLEP